MNTKPTDAREIGFIEDFSLAEKRADALLQLVPGTTDYYYFHCLHAQNTGELEKVRQLAKQWIKREGYTPKVKEILNRQALLEYDRHPRKTLAHIKRELDLRFDHQKTSAHRKTDYPSTLDPELISIPALTKAAFSSHKNLAGIEDAGLEFVDDAILDPDRRRDFLSRISMPDLPNLPEMVIADLKAKHSSGFGSHDIHYRMTKLQLDKCLKLAPDLLDVSNFVHAYVAKLVPDDDTDIQYDRVAKKAYLDRLWGFVKDLKPVHNSLKAHVLYHLLDDYRASESYDLQEVKQRFMAYLKIPRQVTYIDPTYLKHPSRRNYKARLDEAFKNYSSLRRVGNDENLVREYLTHYFITEPNYEAYSTYIRDDYLQHIFAETKIVNGIGDMEQWLSMMPPSRYQALKERIDLDFTSANKQFYDTNEPIELSLYIKNVESVIVKVYEINTFNYYQANRKPIDTSIALDGLVATREKVIDYNVPPIRRIRRTFKFSEIDRPGVYVIEFIGNGKSSRAVIRKGHLYAVDRVGPAGHEFTVHDKSNQRRSSASIHLAGRQFKPDKNGVITVPFTQKPGLQDIIIQDGDQSAFSHFNHKSENYHFTSGFYVDRESLIKGNTAQVLIRPMLEINGTPISLSLLEQVRLAIVSTNIDGVQTIKEIEDVGLHEDKESVIDFRVPENLQSIRFTLSAKIKNISLNKKEVLSAHSHFNLNAMDTTLSVEGCHLSHHQKGYVLELFGKNGEPKPNRLVNIEFKHRYFIKTVHVSLQTDKKGRVQLGRLQGIAWVKAQAGQDHEHTWPLSGDVFQYSDTIHARAEKTLRIPYIGPQTDQGRMRYALFERRGQTIYSDRTDAVEVKDGFLTMEDLSAGDYELHLKDVPARMLIRLTRGKEGDDYIMSEQRVLEVNNPSPLHIRNVDVKSRKLVVHLANASDTTRVHLFGTRFVPAYHPFDRFNPGSAPTPFAMELIKPQSHYVAGRDIGDEYRYVLERAQKEKYPGNMLNRPELLINPWSLGKTKTAVDQAKPQGDYRSPIEAEAQPMVRESSPEPSGIAETEDGYANLDCLAAPSIVVANLKPDENGRIVIDRKSLGDSRQIHLVAADSFGTVYRQIALNNNSIKTRELRQAQSFDTEKHFSEQKKATALKTGEAFELSDIVTSEFEIYDALEKVYNFLITANDSPTLREFGFIVNWPNMAAEEKLKKYTKYACHELNIFLYHKDRKFFDKVILPHLKKKKDKTFLDHWMTGADLSRYLEPWAYGQLNIAEQILLARRHPDESDRIKRYVKERHDMIPPDVEHDNRLFEMALKAKSLDGDDAFGIDSAKAKAAEALMVGGAPQELGAERSMAEALDDESPRSRTNKSTLKRKAPLRALKLERDQTRGFFKKLDKTREWAENNYYKLPIQDQNAELVRANAFWNDFASNPSGQPFCSEHFIYATRNFTEMMLALAMLDLPFKAAKHESNIQKASFTLKAAGPVIVFHKQIKPVDPVAQKTPIMVSQNYFQSSDPYTYKDNERHDKFIKDEFLFRTAYGCQVVVGNSTSSRQKIWLLMQIPNGAVPVQSGFYSKSIPFTLEPFSTRKFEYHFYFPEAGNYKHYPVQVAKNEEFIASANPWTLKVVEDLSRLDKTSWEYISQQGSERQIAKYLDTHNLNRIDLEKIAFRMRDRDFFEKIIGVLRNRHYYHHALWSYGLYHQSPAIITEYLQHSGYIRQCGSYLRSSLLNIDPVERKIYQHLEYKPLVNARTHPLGGRPKILNDRFYTQYQQFMRVLSYRDRLTHEDLLDVTYYLLLQDRVKKAFDFFKRIDRSKLSTRIQYDYLRLYLYFFDGNISDARALAAKYSDYPVLKWRKMFRHALDQLDELKGQSVQVADDQSRDQHHTRYAAAEAGLDLKIESRKVTLQYQNVKECQVNYYPMDIELLFSRNPFVQQDTTHFTYIRPNHTQSIQLPEESSTFTFGLPDQFKNSNVMVEIKAGSVKRSAVYYANSLDVQVTENYGQIKVSHMGTHLPLPKTYIKCYARMRNGEIVFYKDGYTDLRGRFDYVSLNTDGLDDVEKFAILILNEKSGAVIRQAAPPKR